MQSPLKIWHQKGNERLAGEHLDFELPWLEMN